MISVSSKLLKVILKVILALRHFLFTIQPNKMSSWYSLLGTVVEMARSVFQKVLELNIQVLMLDFIK